MRKLTDYLDGENIKYNVAEGGAITVGGSLDLRGTGITTLPDNLTVGGYLYLRGTDIKQPKKEILDHTSSAYSGENFRNVVTGSA